MTSILLAGLVLLSGLLVKWATQHSVPLPSARPPLPAPIAPPPPEPVDEPAAALPVPFAVDDRGFINSNARCDDTQTAVAIGRTQGSLVVICTDQGGRYGYLGLRLSDEAVLRAAAQTTQTHEFLARNASVTYAVSPVELRVTAGGSVIKQEPMIEYRAPAPR